MSLPHQLRRLSIRYAREYQAEESGPTRQQGISRNLCGVQHDCKSLRENAFRFSARAFACENWV